MKPISIADIVFFMIALTFCILSILWKISAEQFLTVVSMVFSAFYVHKANKGNIQSEPNTSSTTTTVNTSLDTDNIKE